MRLQDLICESTNQPLVIVDIQPAYSKYIGFNIHQFFSFVGNYKGKILWMYNSEEEGFTEDSQHSMVEWLYDNNLDIHEHSNIKLFSKGYGNFRSWIDYGIDDDIIIQVIRELVAQNKNDSRELFGRDEDKIDKYFAALGMAEDDIQMAKDDAIHLAYVCIPTLKSYNNCTLVGGGRNECLAEMVLLFDALRIKYKLLNQFIY